MPYFTTQIDNIQSIFQTWENLSEPNKSMRINHILPFLQLASIINTVSPDDKLKEILNNFKQYYESDKNQHPLELKTGSSQLSYEKLRKISDAEIGETIPTDRVNEVLKYKNAYHHAHVVVNYYFGNLIDERSFSTDFGDFIKEINDIVQKKLQQQKGTVFDKTENQVLLNQAGDFARQLQESAEIVNNPELVLQWQEQFNSAYPTSYTQKTSQQIGVFQQKSMPSAGSIEEPITIRAGVEVEISFANQNSQSRQAEFDYKTIADLNKILATFNNTEAFDNNYASSKETVNRVNCSKLVKMIEEESLAKNSDQIEHINLNRGTFNLIKKIILQNTKRDNVDLKETEVEKTISKMSKEEALAFLLLFGNEELSHTQSLPINFDGIKPNATAVYELIKNNQFYEKIVDWVHALEIDIFLDKIDNEKIKSLSQKWQNIVYWSNFVGLNLTLVNQQTNFSFNKDDRDLIDYKVKDGTATISELGVFILQKVQNMAKKVDDEHNIFRDSLDIGIGFDAKKSGNRAFFEEAVSRAKQVFGDITNFTIHKQVAAKTSQIRISQNPGGVSIVEIRLAGVNSHNAVPPKGQYDFGLSEELMQNVFREVQNEVSRLTEGEFKKLLNSRVEIVDGKVPILPAIPRIERRAIDARPSSSIEKVSALLLQPLAISQKIRQG